MEEMLKDLDKYFTREDNMQKNHKLLEMREVFRGVVVKERATMPDERINFSPCNKALVKNGVRLHCTCQKKRHEALHEPEVEKNA